MKRATSVLILLIVCSSLLESAKGDITPARPAGPRRITVKEYLSYKPLFITSTATLDPIDWARESWK